MLTVGCQLCNLCLSDRTSLSVNLDRSIGRLVWLQCLVTIGCQILLQQCIFCFDNFYKRKMRILFETERKISCPLLLPKQKHVWQKRQYIFYLHYTKHKFQLLAPNDGLDSKTKTALISDQNEIYFFSRDSTIFSVCFFANFCVPCDFLFFVVVVFSEIFVVVKFRRTGKIWFATV